MLKNVSNLRNVVAIAICLAASMMFFACEKQSSNKQITAFNFTAPPAIGVINEDAKTIAVAVPEDTDVTALVPSIVISEKATVSPASGVAQNFTNPVTYTVTAEDGSAANYIVTVTGGTGGPGTDPDEWTTLSGSMSENRTLKKGKYVVEGTFNVTGNALLTMEAGVEIRFTGVGGGISVSTNAGMAMNGTAAEPIKIGGPINNPNKGSWNRIAYNSDRADNVMNYVILTNGGSGNSAYSSVVELENGQLKMTNCVVDGSGKNGVYSYHGTYTEFSNNEIKNCDQYPVYAYDNIATLEKVNATNTFTGNAKNYVFVGGGNIKNDMTLNKLSVPWYISGSITVSEAALLTIEAGVEINFAAAGNSINVSANAGMAMNGTAEDPIKISGPSTNLNKGAWNRIVYNSDRADNVMNYVHLKNGGSGSSGYSAMVELEHGQLKMTNCVIEGSAKNGVYAYRGTYTEFSNNEIKNCNAYPVYAYDYIIYVKNIDGSNTFTGNTNNYVYVGATSLGESMTLNKLSIPWFFFNGFNVDASSPITLTIEAGAQLYFNYEKKFTIGERAVLVAEGAADNRIVIRGAETTPGYWKGVRIDSGQYGNKINYCDISGSGNESGWNGNSNLYLYPQGDKMRLQVHNTTLSNSNYYGLGLEGAKAKFDQIDWENVTFNGCTGGNVWHYNTGNTYSSFEEFLNE
jgi:hypothetical protein